MSIFVKYLNYFKSTILMQTVKNCLETTRQHVIFALLLKFLKLCCEIDTWIFWVCCVFLVVPLKNTDHKIYNLHTYNSTGLFAYVFIGVLKPYDTHRLLWNVHNCCNSVCFLKIHIQYLNTTSLLKQNMQFSYTTKIIFFSFISEKLTQEVNSIILNPPVNW